LSGCKSPLEKHSAAWTDRDGGIGYTMAATLAEEAADLLTHLKPVLEENERLKRLIWEMDEHVDDCCGCLGYIDQEFRDRINAASLSPSIRSNPDGE
jgi:hypothetical protein